MQMHVAPTVAHIALVEKGWRLHLHLLTFMVLVTEPNSSNLADRQQRLSLNAASACQPVRGQAQHKLLFVPFPSHTLNKI